MTSLNKSGKAVVTYLNLWRNLWTKLEIQIVIQNVCEPTISNYNKNKMEKVFLRNIWPE